MGEEPWTGLVWGMSRGGEWPLVALCGRRGVLRAQWSGANCAVGEGNGGQGGKGGTSRARLARCGRNEGADRMALCAKEQGRMVTLSE